MHKIILSAASVLLVSFATGCTSPPGMIFLLSGCGSYDTPASESGKNTQNNFRGTVSKTGEYDYLLFLPKGYRDSKERFPLILYLHGSGHKAKPGKNMLHVVKREGPPKVAEKIENFPFIIVSPQCLKGRTWQEDVLVLGGLLDKITEKRRVDPDRIYVTGMSAGGYGTWDLANAFPHRFAAIATVCGAPKWGMTDRLTQLPVWAFHGAKDSVVPLKNSQRMIDSLKKRGGNAKFTIYPDADHDAWSATYGNPYLYEWFLQHRKGSPRKTAQIPPAFKQSLEQWKQKYHKTLKSIPQTTCTKNTTSPEIDGILSDKCWAKCKDIAVVTLPGGLPARFATRVKITYDKKYLYLAFRCHEPIPAKLVINKTRRDDPNWSDDSVEIFIDANRDRKSYFHFGINANGVLYDAVGNNKAWNCDVIIKSGREAKAWTLEVAIPLKALGLSKPTGKIIGLNLMRTHQQPWEPAQWSATLGNRHMPKRFGSLKFR